MTSATSLATSNVIIPSGTARMGHFEYNVDINMSPTRVADFNRLPVKIVNGAPVLLGDVASGHRYPSAADQRRQGRWQTARPT